MKKTETVKIIRARIRSLPPYSLVAVVVLALGITGYALSCFNNELLKSIGSNFIADAFVLLLTVFLIDRLIRYEQDRQFKPRQIIIYREAQDIYRNSLSLWGNLLYLATQAGDKGPLDFDNHRKIFEKHAGNRPFSDESLKLMKVVGLSISKIHLKEIILARIQSDARKLHREIHGFMQTHSSIIDARLYAALRHLRESALLRFCIEIEKVDLRTLGGNIVFTHKQNRNLLKSLSSSQQRSDFPITDDLPGGEDWDIDHIFHVLADEVDAIAIRLSERGLVLMPRTLDFVQHALWYSIYSQANPSEA